jgi:hypothetical protein
LGAGQTANSGNVTKEKIYESVAWLLILNGYLNE